MRTMRLLFFVCSLQIFASWADAASAAPQKIVITPASFSEREGMLIAAQNQGFFRKRNLDVQLVLMPVRPSPSRR